ncbi:NUDIX domain-containing protein [Candidatus Berkelbacteria bacterium]|nr:NUDIX domain-containing protein [Candidatus Berkelbacteria bacterium]
MSRDEFSAGAVVFSDHPQAGVKVLVIKDSYGRWAFPKGRIEPNEGVPEAALRETKEEVGLSALEIVAELGNTDFWYRDRWEHPGETVHKRVQYFLAKAPDWQHAQINEVERIQRIHWVSPRELRGIIRYRSLHPVIERAIDHLGQR